MVKNMNLNGLNIESKAVLAPMAGFCDIVMRKVADNFGAGFTISEMVSARALYYGDKKSKTLMETWDHKGRYGIQLFGFDPVDFEHATKLALEAKPDFIDINVGCPAPKITGNGAGSALMKNTDLAAKIAETVVKNANGIPVSVKMRKGWDDDCITCVELAKKVEAAGVNFITVHGRTRKQMYTPGIDMDAIKNVKQAVSIPVIGNGDITTPEDVVKMMDYTGCDAVMIGREALSRPWIFKQVLHYFETGEHLAKPTFEEVTEMILRQTRMMIECKGEYTGIHEIRKHAAWYTMGYPKSSKLRGVLNYVESLEQLEEVLRGYGIPKGK